MQAEVLLADLAELGLRPGKQADKGHAVSSMEKRMGMLDPEQVLRRAVRAWTIQSATFDE